MFALCGWVMEILESKGPSRCCVFGAWQAGSRGGGDPLGVSAMRKAASLLLPTSVRLEIGHCKHVADKGNVSPRQAHSDGLVCENN